MEDLELATAVDSLSFAMPITREGKVSGKRRSLATDMAYAIFTHPLLAESLNILFAMFDG